MKKKIILCGLLLALIVTSACNVDAMSGSSDTEKTNNNETNDKNDKNSSEEKVDNKDKKASKALGEYQKFVPIYDKDKGRGEIFCKEGNDVEFTYDVDLDGKEDNIKLKYGEIRIQNHDFELTINNSKKEFYINSVIQTIWAITLDGENMYIVLEGCNNSQQALYFFQYKNEEVLDQGFVYIDNFDRKHFCPNYDANAINNVKINEDGSIEGVAERIVSNIQNIHPLLTYKADESGKLVGNELKKGEQVDIIEKNSITLLKDVVVYDKPDGSNQKTIPKQTVHIEKYLIGTDDDDAKEDSWYYIKGENGSDEGWLCCDSKYIIKGNDESCDKVIDMNTLPIYD